jgi:hypothetical protein
MKVYCITNTHKEDWKNEKLGDKEAWENMETDWLIMFMWANGAEVSVITELT